MYFFYAFNKNSILSLFENIFLTYQISGVKEITNDFVSKNTQQKKIKSTTNTFNILKKLYIC